MTSSTTRLWNFGFITLNLLILFAFTNLAVFFSFYSYLKTLPVSSEWYGILIGLFAVSAIVLRPFISVGLNSKNAIWGVAAGVLFTAISLLFYPLAHTFISLVILRIIHGAAYVILVSSAIVLLMYFLPANKSGQGFGIVSVATLLPYSIVPYLVEETFAGIPLDTIYSYTALLMIPPALLLIPLAKQLGKQKTDNPSFLNNKITGQSLLYNLKQPKIVRLFIVNILVFTVFSIVLYFLKSFCNTGCVGRPELFFTVSTFTMIFVRIFFGKMFDNYNKALLIIFSLLFFAVGVVLLLEATSALLFYIAAAVYGVGIGSVSPLLNGLVFTISEPEYRGLNTNLMLEMVDGGFFLGPSFAGLAVSAGLTVSSVFYICVGVVAVAAIVVFPLIKTESYGQQYKF